MNAIKKALVLKDELDALRPIAKEDEQRIMQKFKLDWTYHSNKIEGNALTYGETKALILHGITAQGKPLKDALEISGHHDAVNWIMDVVDQKRPLTENFIRELHETILKERYQVDAETPDGKPTKKWVEVGKYKSSPNHVKTKTGEIFRFATPEETPAKMKDLLDWFNSKIQEKDFNPILVAAEFHYKFILIHPFDDGNGRTARILMNFILLQNYFPPVVIKTEEKADYLGVLQLADAGNISPFIEFIAQNLVHSLEIMIKGAKGESVEEPDDIDKEIAILERKFLGISEPIEKIRSIKTVKELFENSIIPLIELFFEKSRKFDNIYRETEFLVIFNNTIVFRYPKQNIDQFLLTYQQKIDTKPTGIFLESIHRYGSRIKLDKIAFSSKIEIKLEEIRYKILIEPQKEFASRLYVEELKGEEIQEIVNIQLRKHAEYLSEQIKKTE